MVESGSSSFLFKSKDGALIAQGYVRVVYGDGGPYIELMKDQVAWENLECERRDVGYFNKWYTKTGRIMVYEQLRTVGTYQTLRQESSVSTATEKKDTRIIVWGECTVRRMM